MSEPIRILHMIGSLNIGGSQSMIINLHKAIDKTKVQFDYIIDHPGHLYYESVVKSLGGKVYELPTFKGYNFLEIWKAWNQFFKEHPEYKILHSHVRSYASLYLPIAKKAGLKTIIHSHNTSNGRGIASVVKRFMQYFLRNQSDYFFGCSKEAGEWLFGEEIANSTKYHILQNAIESDKYTFCKKNREMIRDEFGIQDSFLIGNIGRLTVQKNQSFLLDIFKIIYEKNKKTCLMIVGAGDLEQPLKQRALKLGIDSAVIFTGSRSDVSALLSAMDVFVFPSLWEGLGIVAVEAQASGLHTICSNFVPKEVKVTNLIDFVSLNDPAEKWADIILKYSPCVERPDTHKLIVDAGYDVKESVKWLENFYGSI